MTKRRGAWYTAFELQLPIKNLQRIMEGVNSAMTYLIYYKNFCNCHYVPPAKQ
jgi:hypothetical protein